MHASKTNTKSISSPSRTYLPRDTAAVDTAAVDTAYGRETIIKHKKSHGPTISGFKVMLERAESRHAFSWVLVPKLAIIRALARAERIAKEKKKAVYAIIRLFFCNDVASSFLSFFFLSFFCRLRNSPSVMRTSHDLFWTGILARRDRKSVV